MKITVGVSNRHAHLTKETLNELFGKDVLEVRNYLNQPGEFASTSQIDIKYNDKIINKVRVVGPTRSYNQVEISKSDADYLEINPPRRKSGDVVGSNPITLIGPNGEVNLSNGLIMAERHVHLSKELAKELDLEDEDQVIVYKDNKELFLAVIKLKESSYTELHIDIDDAKKYNLKQNDEVEIYKLKNK